MRAAPIPIIIKEIGLYDGTKAEFLQKSWGFDLNEKKIYIVILNYENWRDTLECLESVMNLRYDNFHIIVCDNGSHDRSLFHLKAWAESFFNPINPYHSVSHSNRLPFKPLSYAICQRSQLDDPLHVKIWEKRLFIIDNKENLGFAGGNNVGILFALRDLDLDFVWILNNDTVVESDALTHLVRKMCSGRNIGLCGSTLLYYHDKQRVQALGGFSYNKFLGLARQIGHMKRWEPKKSSVGFEKTIENKIFGVQGASVFVSRHFLEQIGLMSEEYFLYFEEQDWAVRGREKFRLGYASESIVYHKEGRTTKSNSFSRQSKNMFSEFCLVRSRFLFTKKYYPSIFLFVYISQVLLIFKRLLQGNYRNAICVGKILIYFGVSFLGKMQRENAIIDYEDFLSMAVKIKGLIKLKFLKKIPPEM